MNPLTLPPEDLVPGGVVVCVDVGSTFTKAAAVGTDGRVLATAQRATTARCDVLMGMDDAIAALGLGMVDDGRIIACSSAGGGLRLAVVGHERVISAEAGRRVALSAGARVVAVSAGLLDSSGIGALAGALPDVLLLVGGTDGGDSDVLLHNARVLGGSQVRVPVVLAGNAEVAQEAARLLRARRRAVHVTDNVIPRIGELAPGPARRAIREVFIAHVIGGKGLSRGPRFARLVACATPDAVLAGVEVVAEVLATLPGAAGDVMAVDVGGATTDVYSVLTPVDEAPSEVVETLWHGRSVEGDLGMRWSAPDVVEAALAERLLAAPPSGGVPGAGLRAGSPPAGKGSGGRGSAGSPAADAQHDVVDRLRAAAEVRHHEVGILPQSDDDRAVDLALARLAAVVAVRRHARPGREGSRDLTHVGLLIGSGGVLRHGDSAAALDVLDAVLSDYSGGWRLPDRARTLLDRQYLLAPMGLLEMSGRGEPARTLATQLLGAAL